MRRYVANRSDSLSAAVAIREKFIDAPVTMEETLDWNWPRKMQSIGRWQRQNGAVMYTSNKWQSNAEKFIDYKHVAEGPQRLLAVPKFIRQYHRTNRPIRVYGPMVDLNRPMPTAFAVLAPILGIQAQLYDSGTDEHPETTDDSFYNIVIGKAMLGAAEHPETGRTFLFVYTEAEGPLCVITGDELDVEKDGIVG
jgi:hypothetical protein